jgi:hypothetical protein
VKFESIKYIFFTCILLVEGSNLKSMSGHHDESTGKDEGGMKSTPSINQEVALPSVSSTDTKGTKL